MLMNVVTDDIVKSAGNSLMPYTWRSHHIDLTVDQFGTVSFGEIIDVIDGIALSFHSGI
jgi:hypothetical protein